MISSARYNGVRRVTWIFALSGILVFIMYSLHGDGVTEDVSAKRSTGRPYDRRPFAQVWGVVPGKSGAFRRAIGPSGELTNRRASLHRPLQSIIHLDLKGAPPIMSVYEWLFPLLKKMGAHGVLMEYEDMFPYSGDLAQIKRPDHYSSSDIARINQLAADNSIEIIPLVQTFGHMEFILKHPAYAELRENITAVLPSLN
ncbi:hypothetical protein Y032_0009g819 [Ancylostoma ceylanicum]|uniref:Beta-N-acetylhexosaminidase n=1 Tax=Ancylostoma ceylanicum TaxID=53326 RepID=A0A016VJ42_9BILA|nr:hypothetical protein Y032_0009g819 [Ancylostoma ceylanicum]